MPPTTTTSPTPTPSVPNGPLAHFLAHPNAWWADLGHHVAHIGEAVLPAVVAVLTGLTALVVAWGLVRAIGRLRPPAAGQLVEVSLPASVEPKGALAFWRNLHPVLAGGHRLLHPPRHVAFEIEASDAGIRLRLWTAAGVPAPAVSRAVGSAWPGAQCQVREASVPLLPGPLVSCRELRLAAPAWLPLGTDHGVDPLRAVLGALYVDAVGEHAVVQVLARPARNPRAAVIGRAARSLPSGRPIATIPRLLAAWRTTPHAPMRPDPMRSADARHALDKAIDLPSFEVVVRFGVSAHDHGHAPQASPAGPGSRAHRGVRRLCRTEPLRPPSWARLSPAPRTTGDGAWPRPRPLRARRARPPAARRDGPRPCLRRRGGGRPATGRGVRALAASSRGGRR